MRFGKGILVALLGLSLLGLGGCSIFSAKPVGAESGNDQAAQAGSKGGKGPGGQGLPRLPARLWAATMTLTTSRCPTP